MFRLPFLSPPRRKSPSLTLYTLELRAPRSGFGGPTGADEKPLLANERIQLLDARLFAKF